MSEKINISENSVSHKDAYLASSDKTVSRRFRELIPEKARRVAKTVLQQGWLTASALIAILTSGCGNVNQVDVDPIPIQSSTSTVESSPSLPFVKDVPPLQSKPEQKEQVENFSVDIYMDENTSNEIELKEWIATTINSYVNGKFQSAGINRRLKVDQILPYDKNAEYPNYGKNNKLISNKIQLFIEAPGSSFISSASPGLMQMRLIPQLGLTEQSQLQLTHEFGHIFGLPDYYMQNTGVDFDLNGKPIEPFSGGIYPTSNIKDIMLDPVNHKDFSEFSKRLIDLLGNPPFGDVYKEWTKYTPQQVDIQLVDKDDIPLRDASVELYPEIVRYDSKGYNPWLTTRTSMSPTIRGRTDQSGQFILGDYNHIFAPPEGANAIGPGYSAILRLANNGQQCFTSINVDSLVQRYMDGDKSKTVFKIVFKNNELVRQ
jgi:hypothetical protein